MNGPGNGATRRRGGEGGRGFIQLVLALLVIGAMTWLALKMYHRSGIEQVAPTGVSPARPVVENTDLRVEGMHSNLDALQVTEALRRVPGVVSADCDSSAQRCRVSYSPNRTGVEQLLAAVNRSGYRASRR